MYSVIPYPKKKKKETACMYVYVYHTYIKPSLSSNQYSFKNYL